MKIYLKNGFNFLEKVGLNKKLLLKSKKTMILGNMVDFFGKATSKDGKIDFSNGTYCLNSNNLMLDYYVTLKKSILKGNYIKIVTDSFGKEYFVDILETMKKSVSPRKHYLINHIIKDIYVCSSDNDYMKYVEENNLKFDLILGNPPYIRGNKEPLWMEILFHLLEKCSAKCVVWLCPKNYFTNISLYKDSKTYGKMLINCSKRLTDSYLLTELESTEIFGDATFFVGVGVFVFNSNKKPMDLNSIQADKDLIFYKNKFESFVKSNKVSSIQDIGDLNESGNFVRVVYTHGNPGKKDQYDIISYDINKVIVPTKSSNHAKRILHVDTTEEQTNLFNSLHLEEMKFVNRLYKSSATVAYKQLPWLGSIVRESWWENINGTYVEHKEKVVGYEKPWSSKDLQILFGWTDNFYLDKMHKLMKDFV